MFEELLRIKDKCIIFNKNLEKDENYNFFFNFKKSIFIEEKTLCFLRKIFFIFKMQYFFKVFLLLYNNFSPL